MLNIGKNIKKLRKEKSWLQKQMAVELNISQSYYNKIENGQREPSLEVVKKLANMFNVSVDQLLDEETVLTEIKIEDKSIIEKVNLIQELTDREQSIIYEIIDTMLTKKKFKNWHNLF